MSGEGKGADEAPYLFKLSYGLHYKDKLVGITPFEPDWEQNGKAAGILRNRDMALYADCLVAFWDGESRGTKHMIETMMELDKPFLLYGFNGRRL